MLQQIFDGFKSLLPCDWAATEEQKTLLCELVDFSVAHGYTISTNYEQAFVEAVNQKLALNAKNYQRILDTAFSEGIKLNYILKTKIRRCLDSANYDAYRTLLMENEMFCEAMISAFSPVTIDTTYSTLADVVNDDKQYLDIITSIFSRFCFNLFDMYCTSHFFSGDDCRADDYFEFIYHKFPDMCKRDCALAIIDVDPVLFINGYHQGCNTVLSAIYKTYEELNNHCIMAVRIPDIVLSGTSYQWRLYSDVTMFSEKLRKEAIDRTYFRWKKIKEQTEKYIEEIKSDECEFEYGNTGFVFKDCFVTQEASTDPYALVLVFEKNVRDERPVNCPACRSKNIQGNSYPILNVRSWECQNPLCPDRSKYNRGKRYAFMSLMRQRKMEDENNRIPQKSITKWHLDRVNDVSKEDTFEMLVRHYSCVNDGVVVYTTDTCSSYVEQLGRQITYQDFTNASTDIIGDFKASSYFKRYLVQNRRPVEPSKQWSYRKSSVHNGDSFSVLRKLDADSIDAAVTSPPYYNAKAYSQWTNIYCYLYDMYNISREVYRVLKPGSVYLFNIFDYFDNENNIVFSAMGNKRMILGAYMIDIFERIGFTVQGNIIWDKGEIQGNRNFNQGNMTPYYQAPLNCWEHIFVLSKGVPDKKYSKLSSSVASIKPVIKMIRGRNVLGHSAPYPEEIPELIISCMDQTDVVLDPFLGSGTTSIVANKYGVGSIGIERSQEYFELCKKRIATADIDQITFF